MGILADRIAAGGVSTLYSGALGSLFATLVGHYPWFITYNFMQARIPKFEGVAGRQLRSAPPRPAPGQPAGV